MLNRHDVPILWLRIRPLLKQAASTNGLAALAVSGLCASALLAWSENFSPQASSGAPAASQATTNTAAVSLQSCERQAWPYLDPRCGPAAGNSQRKTRAVHIVTGNGETRTVMMPVPIAGPPEHPASLRHVATAPMQIGPPAIPVKSSAQPETVVQAPEQTNPAPEQTAKADVPIPTDRSGRLAKAPETAGADRPADTEKSAAAPNSHKHQAKTAKQDNAKPDSKPPAATSSHKRSVPAEVIAAVQALAPRAQSQEAVPDDVIAAVRAARALPVERRVYLVPGENW